MQTPVQLNEQFQSDSITFIHGEGGLSKCIISNQFADAEIYLHGAHVTHFQPSNTGAVLWLSEDAIFDSAKAIRGGIPICWPWFGPHPDNSKFPQHGFARVSQWNVDAVTETIEGTELILGLYSSEASGKYLNGEFEAKYKVSVGSQLTVELGVTNTGSTSLSGIGGALHSYFAISNIDNVLVDGLNNKKFLDQLTGKTMTQSGHLQFEQEVDSVYFGTSQPIGLIDELSKRRLQISSEGSESCVVWNPWTDKSKLMGDFPDTGFQTMVCIETANAFSDVRGIEPGETHLLSQTVAIT
ncbi:MAG: glucose-6-phosphate 1-epimerase [Halioglobus sp.]|jgi:glucose-6-phosphate 1-epimerase